MSHHSFTIVQSTFAEAEPSDGLWKCPPSHTPIARLTVALAWKRPDESKARSKKERKIFASAVCTAVILVPLVASAVLATTYLCGLLAQKVQQLQQYNRPQASYSDASKYASHP